MTPNEFKLIRQQLGLTQAALAKEMGKSHRQIQRYEENAALIPEHVIKMLSFMLAQHKTKKS